MAAVCVRVLSDWDWWDLLSGCCLCQGIVCLGLVGSHQWLSVSGCCLTGTGGISTVALNYGMFRRGDFNATTQHIMFYDIGADSTAATLVGYQLVKTKERGFTETNPQLHVLGYA